MRNRIRRLFVLLSAACFLLLSACTSAGGNGYSVVTSDLSTGGDGAGENGAVFPLATGEIVVALSPSRAVGVTEEELSALEALLIAFAASRDIVISGITWRTAVPEKELKEQLADGTIDAVLLPEERYRQTEENLFPVALSTANGIRIDPADSATWNKGKGHAGQADNAAVTAHTLILAGPSEAGRALAEKVLDGQALTAGELEEAGWCVLAEDSVFGYVMADEWLNENYGLRLELLPELTRADSYLQSFQLLAEEKADIIAVPCDLRMEFAQRWESSTYYEDMARDGSVYEETTVIGVTKGRRFDAVAVSKKGVFGTAAEREPEALRDALLQVLQDLAASEEGRALMERAGHSGYVLPETE